MTGAALIGWFVGLPILAACWTVAVKREEEK